MGEDARRKLMGNGFVPHLANAGKPAQFEVDIKNTTEVTCPCGCKYFMGAVMLRKVSAIVSPTGQEMLAQQPVVICVKCKEIYMPAAKDAVIDIPRENN